MWREAANFPYLSGEVVGLMKLAMAQVMDELVGGKLLDIVHPALQIHDEILFVCREDMAQELGELVKDRFENIAPLRVPIKAEAAIGKTWGGIAK